MSDLVERLSVGKHPIIFEERTKEMHEIKTRLINLKFVFVKFTNTKGGTELGIKVDDELTKIEFANFENGTGSIHLVGTCILDYQDVCCVAEVDLATRKGLGSLQILDDPEKILSFSKH